MDGPQRVESVTRALRLIEIISREQKIGISELARKSELKKTTVARLAATLEQAGLVAQDVTDKRYFLTIKLFELGSRVLGSLNIRHQSRPLIERFVNEHAVSVLVSVLDGNEVLYIDKVESNDIFRIKHTVGSRSPVHCTASGKALIAFMEPQRLKEILKGPLLALTPHTLTDYASLAADMAATRARGYSLDKKEWHLDLCAAGAPIFNSSGGVIAAVSVPRMATVSDGQLATLGERVALLARAISGRWGWPGNKAAQYR